VAYKRKSWGQKWEEAVAKKDLPKVIDCPDSHARFVVPNPAEVEKVVRTIPVGHVMTMCDVASRIAAKHGTESCCSMTTGIFAWILAHASVDDPNGPLADVPWWRVVKARGELNLKYPNAPDLQRSLLESEGKKVTQRGSKYFVSEAL
jgi:alkylated DNA nucleotide flippase Atl1